MRDLSKLKNSTYTWLGIISIIFLCTFIIYFQSLYSQPLSYDDGLYIYENNNIQHGVDLGYAMKSDDSNLWHPTTWISHQLDWYFFPKNPAAHHLINCLLHAFNAILIIVLLNLTYKKIHLAAIVGLLFCCHPISVEVVAWESQRKELLALFFILLSAITYVHHFAADKPHSRILLIISVLLFALASGSKPNAVAYAPVIIISSFLYNHWSRRTVKIYLSIITVIALIVISINFQFTKNSGLKEVNDILPFSDRINQIPHHVVHYIESILNLSERHLLHVPFAPSHWITTLTLSIAVVIISSTLYYFNRKITLISLAVIICFWIPTSGILPVSIYHVADRYIYISQIGVYFLIANIWASIDIKFRRHSKDKIFTAAFLLFFSGSLAALTISSRKEASYWKSSLNLFNREVSLMPNDLTARMHYAKALSTTNQIEQSLYHSKVATKLDSNSFDAQLNLAQLYFATDDAILAKHHLKLAINSSRQHQSLAYDLLSYLEIQQENIPDAISTLELGHQYFPDNNNLAVKLAALLHNTKQDTIRVHDLISGVLSRDPSHEKALHLRLLIKEQD